jgi:hypothetical protein
MLYKTPPLLLVLILLQALSLTAASTLNAASDAIFEFDYVNTPRGYTTTVSIHEGGMTRLDSIRTSGFRGNSYKALKLNTQQMGRLQTLMNQIEQLSLEAEYGMGFTGTEAPSFHFRFRTTGGWKETRIDPFRNVPSVPEPLLALEKFMMSIVFPR